MWRKTESGLLRCWPKVLRQETSNYYNTVVLENITEKLTIRLPRLI